MHSRRYKKKFEPQTASSGDDVLKSLSVSRFLRTLGVNRRDDDPRLDETRPN